jgi:hypothetical protein
VIGNEVSRWALSALFAGLGAWYLAAAGRELLSGRRHRLGPAAGAGLHVAMCVVMIAMSWSWGTDIPAIAQVTVFTAGGGWFAGQALFGTRTRAASAGGPVMDPVGEHGASWYHTAMMGAMVWMAVAMSALTTPMGVPAVSAAAATAGTAGSAASMSGMAMSTGQGPAAMAMGTPAGWVSAGCLLLCAAFFAAALFFAVTLWRHPRRGALLGAGAEALMAAGMAVALLELAPA